MATKHTKKSRSTLSDVVTREYTVNLHREVHGKGFKHRAPTATKAVVKFAQKTMGTRDVRVDPSLNAFIWSKGIKNVPRRVRVRLARKRNNDSEAKEKLYTVAEYVPTKSFSYLGTNIVDEEEE